MQPVEDAQIPAGGPRAKARPEPTCQFVVLGDTHRFGREVVDQIRQINQLAPDLVVHLGDFVADTEAGWCQLEPMLDLFEPALYMVPGNHDIFNESSRRIYEARFGRTYYSFDHKAIHFVSLDSEIPLGDCGRSLRIHGEQLAWLAHDLEQNDSAPLKFVFVHKPLWLNTDRQGDSREWWMRDVHPILAKHRVSGVFAGHLHKYIESPMIDGVRYYVTFSAGGRLFDPDECHGNFHHCSLVSVRGTRWNLAVLRPREIEPPDCVQMFNPYTVKALQGINAVPTLLDRDSCRMPITIDIANTSPHDIDYSAEPVTDLCPQWRFEPSKRRVRLSGGQSATLSFTGMLSQPDRPYPGPKFCVNVDGLENHTLQRTQIIPFGSAMQCRCSRTAIAPTIDGRLDDAAWSACETIGLSNNPTGQGPPAGTTDLRLAWDDRYLYLGVRCLEPLLENLVCDAREDGDQTGYDDSIELFLPAGLDAWHHFIWNANGVLHYERNQEPGNPEGHFMAKTGRDTDAWMLEAAFDMHWIGASSPSRDATIGFQIVRNRVANHKECSMWLPTFGTNFTPEFFGTILLM